MSTPPGSHAPRPAMPTFANPLPPGVVDALQRGDKLEAIKLMRQLTGIGLKEAKDSVEASPHAAAASSDGVGLSPGEVPRTGRFVWAAVVAVVFVLIVYRLLRGE